jgi:hypothetical protein
LNAVTRFQPWPLSRSCLRFSPRPRCVTGPECLSFLVSNVRSSNRPSITSRMLDGVRPSFRPARHAGASRNPPVRLALNVAAGAESTRVWKRKRAGTAGAAPKREPTLGKQAGEAPNRFTPASTAAPRIMSIPIGRGSPVGSAICRSRFPCPGTKAG